MASRNRSREPEQEKPLTSAEISGFERRLKNLLDSYTEQVGKVEEAILEPSGDPDGQAEDESVEDTAFERDSEVLATIDQLAYQVREALQRVTEGSFGSCALCGITIDRVRLDQVPYASLCATCAHQEEGEQR
ncbi:MAG: TraR/DksA C4-type zinc finger protein [Planctomycetota bacterium]